MIGEPSECPEATRAQVDGLNDADRNLPTFFQ